MNNKDGLQGPEWRADGWFEKRLGVPTGSRAYDIVTRSRSYHEKLLRERQTGIRDPDVDAPPLQWGRENEPLAIAHYELMFDVDVAPGRLCYHPDKLDEEEQIIYWRGTPDGFVGDDGIIEVKCPYVQANHVKSLAGYPPRMQYVCQMEAYLGITGRKWCDFISFDPRQSFDKQFRCVRYFRNPDLQAQILSAVDELWLKIKSGQGPLTDALEPDSPIPPLFGDRS